MESRRGDRHGARCSGDGVTRSRAVDHRCRRRPRRLRIRHGRDVDPLVRGIGRDETPHRSSCGALAERTRRTRRSTTAPSGHAPLMRVPNAPTDLVSAPPGTQEHLPRRRTDPRTIPDPVRPTGAEPAGVVPTREATHRGSEERGFETRTGRRRGRGTGPPDRSPIPRHPPGDTVAHDGFGRRTNSLATYLRFALPQCKPHGRRFAAPGDEVAPRSRAEASTKS